MQTFEASLQIEIYGAAVAQRRIFRERLKEELEELSIWSAPHKAIASQELDRSIFGATELKRRKVEKLYQEALQRQESRIRAGASRGPKSKFSRDVAKQRLTIKTAVYGRSWVTAAATKEYEEQLSVIKRQATDIMGEWRK